MHQHISVCEDTLLYSFPPIIYSFSHHYCPKATGSVLAVMTNMVTLFPTRIQRGQNTNLEHETEALQDVNQKRFPVCFSVGGAFQERRQINVLFMRLL